MPSELLWVLLLCSVLSVTSLTVKIEPKEEQCFYQYVENNQVIELNYGVSDGGKLDILVKFFKGFELLHEKMYFEGKDSGYFSYTVTSPDIYGVCFNNKMSRFTPKTVVFSLSETKNLEHVSPDDISPIEKYVVKMEKNVDYIKGQQKYFRRREKRHRRTAESTNSRVYVWSLIQSLVLILMTVAQVVYLRRILTNPRGSDIL